MYICRYTYIYINICVDIYASVFVYVCACVCVTAYQKLKILKMSTLVVRKVLSEPYILGKKVELFMKRPPNHLKIVLILYYTIIFVLYINCNVIQV